MKDFCCALVPFSDMLALFHTVTLRYDEERMSDLPDFLTVEEAARVLRIGRNAAYEQTRLFEETGGQKGIPVIRVGRLMRVPRAALERWSGGPLSTSLRSQQPPREEPTTQRRRHAKPRLAQEGLPFSS